MRDLSFCHKQARPWLSHPRQRSDRRSHDAQFIPDLGKD